MATIVNARDVLLQAASPRVVPMSLPPNVTVPNGQVLGLGELALLDAISTSKVSGLGALATQDVIDLATQTTGQLASGKVSGLGALALLNQINLATQATGSLSYSNVSGLGALATQNSVNGSTQVTNLGVLAYANSIAAENIGAGSLAAGVIYSGKLYTGSFVHAYGSNPSSVSSPAWGTQYPTVYGQSTTSNGAGGLFSASGTTSTAITAFSTSSSNQSAAAYLHGGSYARGLRVTASDNHAIDADNYSTTYPAAKIGNANTGNKSLDLRGPMSINDNSLVANLNAQYLQGKTPSDFASASSLSNYATNAYVNDNFLKAGGTFTGRTNSGAFLKVTAGAATIYLPIYL